MTGGVHFTGDDFSGRQGALVADAAHPQDGVHTVFRVHRSLQFGDFHDHGAVQQHHDLLEVGLGQLDELMLVVVQLEVVVVGVSVAGHVVGGSVHVFTAEAGNGHERHVVKSVEGAGDGLAVIAHARLQQAAGSSVVVHAAHDGEQVFVQVNGLGVDVEALLFKGLHPIQAIAGGAGLAGAAAAAHIVDGGDAQEGHVPFVSGKRQGAVFVLEQHLAFFHHFHVEAVARCQRFIQGGIVRIEQAVGVQVARLGTCGFLILGLRQRGDAGEDETQRQEQGDEFLPACAHEFSLL